MSKKSGNIFEQHIDKIVLVVIALACFWLLFFYIFGNPAAIEYRGKKLNPSQIDIAISSEAKGLEQKLNAAPSFAKDYKLQRDLFLSKFESAISQVDDSVYFPLPNHGAKVIHADRLYDIPEIGGVNDVDMFYVRAVAYVPTEQVRPDKSYGIVDTELGDIDFVTVQASFDVAAIYKSFYDSFISSRVREDWRNERFGTPVFASVQLQRQELGDNDNWSDWEIINRTKIDHLNQSLNIPQKVQNLSLGMEILLVQFETADFKIGLIQPGAYDFAYPSSGWLAPKFYKKRIELDKKAREQLERETRAGQRGRRKDVERRPQRDVRRGGRSRGGQSGQDEGLQEGRTVSRRRDRGREDRRSGRRRERTPKSPRSDSEVVQRSPEEEFKAVRINADGSFKDPESPLVFWAHDDSAQPGTSYRYRIRLGVFNPIAGMNWFSDEDQHLKNEVVLWSDFSDISAQVDIPARDYFFPQEVREADKAVTVQISKYLLGRWYSKDFIIKPGETMGKVVLSSVSDEISGSVADGSISIDFSTGVSLVDVMPTSDWDGVSVLVRRDYSELIYTDDGTTMKHLAVKERYWPDELRSRFREIKEAQKQPPIEFQPRLVRSGSRTSRGRNRIDRGSQQRSYRQGPTQSSTPTDAESED